MDRALVAVTIGDGKVHLGWRFSAKDDPDLGFDVFRKLGQGTWEKCNSAPITETSDFVDVPPNAPEEYSWYVQPVMATAVGPASNTVQLAPGRTNPPYVVMPLLGDNYQRAAIADLDGDGKLDWVIKRPITSIDPFVNWIASPDTYKIEAYANDGTALWQYDLGWPIELGIWYSPYIVHDLNADGIPEVILKTGEGDPRDADGKVTSGPEYLTVLDGSTGAEIAQTDWLSRDGFEGYHQLSRNQIGLAYLDGAVPHIIIERGTYGVIKVAAFRLDGSTLTEVWQWDNIGKPAEYRGQGAHWIQAADLDEDGFEEVIIGSLVLDHDGVPLWTTGLGHPDHVFLGDLDPGRPGWEIFFGLETAQSQNGMCMVDAKTGQILWGYSDPTSHIHHAFCADITADQVGTECYGEERNDSSKRWWWSSSGDPLETDGLNMGSHTLAYWDGDRQRELVGMHNISDYLGETMVTALYGNITQVADIMGDWREEIIVSPTVPLGEIRIYTTNIPAEDRRPWLMQDPIYGMNVNMVTSGYWQEPMMSYDLETAQ